MGIENVLSKNYGTHYTVYTDGACLGNPGPGGWGSVIINNNVRNEICGYDIETTNNRMEMMAVIKALESIKFPSFVTVYSDSKYIVDTINKKWVYKWKKNNWQRDKNELAKNIDLWEKLLIFLETHKVEIIWVKGHAGNTENEVCDKLAVKNATIAKNKNNGLR